MRKEYLKPVIRACEMETALLASSGITTSGNGNVDVDYGGTADGGIDPSAKSSIGAWDE